MDGILHQNDFCAHTFSVEAFWEVDLERQVRVRQVILYNRIACCGMFDFHCIFILFSSIFMLIVIRIREYNEHAGAF